MRADKLFVMIEDKVRRVICGDCADDLEIRHTEVRPLTASDVQESIGLTPGGGVAMVLPPMCMHCTREKTIEELP